MSQKLKLGTPPSNAKGRLHVGYGIDLLIGKYRKKLLRVI